jgi:DNA mismatch endonuclease (patch repair protein)
MMSGIRGKNTRIELILRSGLHAVGFRYRIHPHLPGRPDLVFPKLRAAIFVHGCFWHAHNCHLFKWPKSRVAFWQSKISGNAERDRRNEKELLDTGWRIGVVWECALKGKERIDSSQVVELCSTWLKSNRKRLEVKGSAPRSPVRLLRGSGRKAAKRR